MNDIIDHVIRTYAPLSLIVYGSYADGSNNVNSDFDALVITADHEIFHDTSCVNGVQLDVFVYPESHFNGDIDPDEFLQIFDGKIILDHDDCGKDLQRRVCAYIEGLPQKTDSELKNLVDWCAKMRLRARRRDAEGMFRWHWLLTDSLEIFCNIKKHFYFGPKKTLRWMQQDHPESYAIYENALCEMSTDALDKWIAHLENII